MKKSKHPKWETVWRPLLAIMILGCSILGHSQEPKTIKGILVDLECLKEKKDDVQYLRTKHTTKCFQMPECLKSGFGVLTTTDDVLIFDPAGNTMAISLLKKSRQNKPLKIKVRGRVKGWNLEVERIGLVQ